MNLNYQFFQEEECSLNNKATPYQQRQKKTNLLKQFMNKNYRELQELQRKLMNNNGQKKNYQEQKSLKKEYAHNQQQNVVSITSNKKTIQSEEEQYIITSAFKKLDSPITLQIQTKHNWIDNYLNKQLSKVILMVFNQNRTNGFAPQTQFQSKHLQIVKYQNSMVYLQPAQCQTQLNPLNQVTNKIQNDPIKISSLCENSLLIQRNIQRHQLDMNIKQFCLKYPIVQATFIEHLYLTNVIDSKQFSFYNSVKLKLNKSKKQQNQFKILLSCSGQPDNYDEIKRVIILKLDDQIEDKYSFQWGKYHTSDFIQQIILSPGEYIIMTLSSQSKQQITIDLVLDGRILDFIQIHKTHKTQKQKFQLLCQSFSQCQTLNNNLQSEQQQIPIQFFRQNFMNCGIILQIYHNVHNQMVIFADKNKQYSQQQDKLLLFEQIYEKRHLHDIYKPKQFVIKFFEISKMPARIFLPNKQLIIGGDKTMQNTTINSIFK